MNNSFKKKNMQIRNSCFGLGEPLLEKRNKVRNVRLIADFSAVYFLFRATFRQTGPRFDEPN